MKKTRFTESQIVAILKEAEAGMPIGELCRKHGISDASFYLWRNGNISYNNYIFYSVN